MLESAIPGSRNFSWREALWLKKWHIYAIPPQAVEKNIIETAMRLTLIRSFLAAPLTVTSWYRPPSYNEIIGGAPQSQHMLGKACDFTVAGMSADEVRERLRPKLGEFNLRMEDLPQSSWVHIDTACPADLPLHKRFFKP